MPNSSITHGVIGTDGKAPIYDPEALWRIWGMHNIWLGQAGENKHVPKIKDYVIDPDTYTTFIVDHLDPISLIPTLREITPDYLSGNLETTDVLFGVGPGTQADTYRAYLDTSVMPHVCSIDKRLYIGGSAVNYMKLFKSSDLTEDGNVISKIYDSAGNFVSTRVSMEIAAIDSHINYSWKLPASFYLTEALPDGEVVTAVFYSDQGHVVSKRQLLIENTSFIRSTNIEMKYVTHISLSSAFMSPTETNVIEYPLNLPLDSMNMMGTVHYSDGSTMTSSVDGTKFALLGLDQYVSSIIGQRVDLVFRYALSPGEIAYAGIGVHGKYVTEPYSMVTTNPNYSHTVKLFGFPYWVSDEVGYQMRWWLFNLDRNLHFDVSHLVRFDEQSGLFDPKGYGYLQRKRVSIQLDEVSGAFKPMRHVQLVDINLISPASAFNTSWTVALEASTSVPAYGSEIYAKRLTTNTLSLRSNIQTFAEWNTRIYRAVYPLIDPSTEVYPPEPTHFVIEYKGSSTEFSIDDWNKDLTLNLAVDPFATLALRFIKKTSNGDQQLAVAAMLIRP